ncbi:hypothetical protein PG990_006587 [Apiospora arundinis]|uniref:J domain-containing protein n=1 Tax=Apiospora arundinis TaxID=335852 RepID=A0ABR2JC55_9PEZI
MTTAPSSPRRRHILSSINPDLPRLSPEIADEDHAASRHATTAPPKSDLHLPDDDGIGERQQSTDPDRENNKREREHRKTTKFRFKSKHSSRSSHRSSRHRERDYDDDHGDDDREGRRRRSERHRDEGADREKLNDEDDPDRDSRRSHRRSHHDSEHHKHRRRRRHRHRTRSRSPTPPNPHDPPPLDPEAAFRESLFDAMADDEGAAYWEGVYGQPIHVYANARQQPSQGAGGELEQMTDDEYAAYVRQKMWEKTHQGLLEERARREEAKRAKNDKEAEARRLTRQMEESLRRGEERRRRRSWRDKYEEYAAAWAEWDGTVEGMSWPVSSSGSSGERAEISPETVRDFFVNGLDPIEIGESVFLAKLKEERFKWHPDKIQQRLGPGFDETVRRDVTAVFQIIDKLWSDIRAKAKAKT